MSIPDHISSGKAAGGRLPVDILLVIILILTASAAFGLGILAGREMGQGSDDGVWIEKLESASEAQPAAVVSATEPASQATVGATEGKYVASRSGTKYYLPWCGSAGRIKEENKVWFATKEEASAAGYTPATNCPGL